MLKKLIDPLRNSLNLSSTAKTIQQTRGQLGERLAAQYLQKNTAYKMLTRNWSNGREEIDIICRDESSLVFVEVRARKTGALVSGYASINKKKKLNLRKAAYSYMKRLSKRPKTYRFDVIELAMTGKKADRIRHFKNVEVF